MFRVKVQISIENTPTFVVDRLDYSRGDVPNGIEIPDSYLAAIENARRAEDRAVKRLALWIANREPEYFENENLRSLLEVA